MTIVLATKNEHKIKEIKMILGKGVEYQSTSDYFNITIKEVGRSLLENSLTKAVFCFKLTGKPSLADDSGLFVEALGEEPGIYSSRYGKDDKMRIAKVLANLTGKKNRRAEFRVVFVFYYAPNKYEVFEGKCAGQIAFEPCGTNGFGYDPIFIPKGYCKTYAELGPAVKNRISHRAQALKKFKKYLKNKSNKARRDKN